MPSPALHLSLHSVATAAEATERAATQLLRLARQALRARGHIFLALSGGSTPLALFSLLGTPAWRQRFPWQHCTVAWVDERCVPPTHAESNYGAALRSPLPLDLAARVLPMDGTAAEGAAAYERALRQAFALPEQAVPRFDIIRLGMGDDGHTASLFPGQDGLEEKTRLVIGQAPSGLRPRLTMTLPLLNAARVCLFLVTGPAKAPALREAFDITRPPRLPVQHVRPRAGRCIWVCGGISNSGAE